MNWKECTWKKGDDKDSGLIYASDLDHFVIDVNAVLVKRTKYVTLLYSQMLL